MASQSARASNRWGCLARLLGLLLLIGACYWLLFSPISDQIKNQLPSVQGTPQSYHLQGEVSPQQQTALQTLAASSQVTPDVLAADGQVLFLTLDLPIPASQGRSPQEKALYFLSENRLAFGLIDPPGELKFVEKTVDPAGNTFVHYTQQHQGVPVYGSGISVGVTEDGAINMVNANYVPNLELDVKPAVRSVRAEEIALQDLQAEHGELVEKSALVIYAPFIGDEMLAEHKINLAWMVTVGLQEENLLWRYFINARSGAILDKMNLILEVGGQIDLEVWEQEDHLLQSVLYQVMDETGNVSDRFPFSGTLDAYAHAREIYSYYWTSFGRDSYNGEGGKIVIHVNVSNCSNMAFWNPQDHYIYFCRAWASQRDVMAHEFTHGVVGSLVTLDGKGEPRELGEAFGDIFAAFAADETPWQLNGLSPAGSATVIRDVASPHSLGYPAHVSERYCSRNDFFCQRKCPDTFGDYTETYADCGHANSVIFSHAAYLMSEEADLDHGIPRSKLGQLYYYVLRLRMILPNTGQQQAARVLIQSCIQNIGSAEINLGKRLDEPFTGGDCEKITEAFVEVGLVTEVPNQTPPVPVDFARWWDDLRSQLRDWVDQAIGSVRQQIEDMIRGILDQAQAELENGLQNLLRWLLQQLERMVVGLLQGLLRILVGWLQSCTQGFAALIVLPVGMYFYVTRRKRG